MFSFVRQTSFENELPGPTPTDFLLCPSGILEESTEVFSALSFQGRKNPTGERMQETTPVSHKFSGYHVRRLLSKQPISEWPPLPKLLRQQSPVHQQPQPRPAESEGLEHSSPLPQAHRRSLIQFGKTTHQALHPPNSESSRRLIRFAKVAFLF